MLKEIREQLETKFDKSMIKQRAGNFGKTLNYLETHAVIKKLNDAFDSNWSFKIVNTVMDSGHLYLLGELTVPNYENGNFRSMDGKITDTFRQTNGFITKQAFGGKKITVVRQKPGYDGPPVYLDLAADMKACSSDSLKKCASLLGIGLDLYLNEEDKEDSAPEEKEIDASELEVSAPITSTQLSAIKALSSKAKVTDTLLFVSELLGNKITSLDTLNQKQGAKIIVALNSKGNG